MDRKLFFFKFHEVIQNIVKIFVICNNKRNFIYIKIFLITAFNDVIQYDVLRKHDKIIQLIMSKSFDNLMDFDIIFNVTLISN